MAKLQSALLLAAMALVGCATPASLREAGSSLEFTSAKSANAVSICITDRWENINILGATAPVNMRPIENGFSVALRNEAWGKTDLLVDITDTGRGSQSKYYRSMDIAVSRYTTAVAECQK